MYLRSNKRVISKRPRSFGVVKKMLNRSLNESLNEKEGVIMTRRMEDNNEGYVKSYKLKKMPKITRNFTAFVIDDQLKYLIGNGDKNDPEKHNKPVLGELGALYDHFEQNGFKIIGIELKNKHVEVPINTLFEGILENNPEDKHIEKEEMDKVQVAKGTSWMATEVVADRRFNFSSQMSIIRNKFDIIHLQKACINARCGWVMIKRLALKHIESGREILNILNEVKKQDAMQNQELYTAYVETLGSEMSGIDNYSPNNLEFLMEGDCHNVYGYCCQKVAGVKEQQTVSCQGQGLFFSEEAVV